MLHGAWHTVSRWKQGSAPKVIIRLAQTRLVERQSGPRACMASPRACLFICSVCLRDQCKSEIVWLLKSELTHSLLTNYGVFIIIIVTLQHAQLGVEEVI